MGKTARRRGITWCDWEDKFAYKTAADAKRGIEAQLEANTYDYEGEDPGGRLSFYSCRHVPRGQPRHFHIGHDVPRKQRKERSK